MKPQTPEKRDEERRIADVKPEEMRPILAGLLQSAKASFPPGFVLSHARACPYCYHEGRLNLCIIGEDSGRRVALHINPHCEAFGKMTCDQFIEGVDQELHGMKAN